MTTPGRPYDDDPLVSTFREPAYRLIEAELRARASNGLVVVDPVLARSLATLIAECRLIVDLERGGRLALPLLTLDISNLRYPLSTFGDRHV